MRRLSFTKLVYERRELLVLELLQRHSSVPIGLNRVEFRQDLPPHLWVFEEVGHLVPPIRAIVNLVEDAIDFVVDAVFHHVDATFGEDGIQDLTLRPMRLDRNSHGHGIGDADRTLQKLNAPMVQVFIKPWSRPLLILGDFREARDIMSRRTAEFDRSTSSGDLVRGLGPSHHIHLKTSPAWRSQRRLIQDLMSSAFLHHVAGPVMYQNVLRLVDLWRIKSRLAGGRPGALDAMAAKGFTSTGVQRALRSSSSGLDEPVAFDPVPTDHVVSASLELVAAVEDVQGSPFPDLKWWWVNSKPRIRRATQVKEKYIRDEVADAVRRLRSSTGGEEFVKSAVDHMVFRESKLAGKEARKPDFFSRVMMDEHVAELGPEVPGRQRRGAVQAARRALEAAFARATAAGGQPTIQDITESQIPYLDAVIEETLRCSATVPVVDRQASTDAELLGYRVPKGSFITCLVSGPSMMSPAFEIDEKRRGVGVDASKPDRPVRAWDPDGMATFQPERWLVGQDGAFDPLAGPQLAFGLGTRQCYGKRLAYLEMRTLITLVVWNFELLPCPPALSGSKPILVMTNRPKDCYVRLREVRKGEEKL
ncbi:hypothetical protein PG988_012931 [Apiospora saccharicola]